MIIVMKPGSSQDVLKAPPRQIGQIGLDPSPIPESERVALAALGDQRAFSMFRLDGHHFVESVELTRSIRASLRALNAAGENATASKGRHNLGVALRAGPIAEAMVLRVLADHKLDRRAQCGVP